MPVATSPQERKGRGYATFGQISTTNLLNPGRILQLALHLRFEIDARIVNLPPSLGHARKRPAPPLQVGITS
jgi:hypothetical protein